jgi:hypothetical protein
MVDSNSDTLCPDEPKGKKEERQFPIIGRVCCSCQLRADPEDGLPPFRTTKKELFEILCLREFEEG